MIMGVHPDLILSLALGADGSKAPKQPDPHPLDAWLTPPGSYHRI